MCTYIPSELLATSTTTIWISFDQYYSTYNRFIAIFSVIFFPINLIHNMIFLKRSTITRIEKKQRFDHHVIIII